MKIQNGSRILHPDKRMKTSMSQRTRGAKPITRFYTGFRRFGVLGAFIAMLALAFYSASSASISGKLARHASNPLSKSALTGKAVIDGNYSGASMKNVLAGMNPGGMFPGTGSWLAPAVPVQSPSFDESVATYDPANNCETPKTSFVLGESVCVRVSNAPLGPPPQRQIAWVGPDGYILQATDVTPTQQGDTYVIPTTPTTVISDEFSSLTLNNRGTWSVNTIATSDAGIIATAEFTVSDPAHPAVDLSIAVNQVGSSAAPASGNVAFTLEVTNNGPNQAQSVEVRNPVPNDTTFVSIVQNAGPTFTCVDPGGDNPNTTVCTGETLAADEKATFTVIYQVLAGTPNDTVISDTASVSSSITELRNPDNAGAGEAKVGPAGCVVSCPADKTMGNDQDAYGAVVTYNPPTTTGICGTVTSTPASGSFFPVGTTTVSASGETGSPCSFNVTVNDTQAPAISCPADITTQESSPGSGSAVVNYPPPSVTENDPAGAPSTCDHPSGSSFPVGETTVTCTATDAAGNTSPSCSFKVTVEGDGSACALTCPADITVDADAGQCGANVTYPDATASTECGTVSYSKASGSFFPVGTTTVTVSSSTGGRSCTFRVTVHDNQQPVITCPANVAVIAAANSCQATANPGTATATDNCSEVKINGSREDGEPLNAAYPVGTTSITWTATDAAGNRASCIQTVTVRDTVAPTVKLVSSITMAAPADTCRVEVPEVLDLQTNAEGKYGTAADNCAGPERLVITQTPAAATLVGAGDHTITVTVCDGDPNDHDAPPPNCTTKTTVLHVTDGTPPTITVNGANPMTVECHTSFTDPGATANDVCAGSVAVNASGTVDVNTVGTYTITYNASDPAGNAATPKTRTVNVVDTQRPTITRNGASPMTVECHTSFTDPGATASDACAGSVPVTSSGTVDVNTPGTYTITYNASDPAGNAATPVTRTVNVTDTIAPTITLNGQNITLWPPNHTYSTVRVTDLVASASDGCDSTLSRNNVFIQKVTSDEIENGNGDGNTLNDIVIGADCKSVQLRSERDGGGNGRVYTITFKVRDASGNATTVTAQVSVPKSQGNGGAAVDSGVHYTVTSSCP